MATWSEFSGEAPEMAALFEKRVAASGLAMLATLRRDGFPRISPIELEPRGGQLYLGMMPNSTKALDLRRDPRCCLHSATVDKNVGEGDVKLFATAAEIVDEEGLQRWLHTLQPTDYKPELGQFHLFEVDLVGGSSVRVDGDVLRIEVWTPGAGVRVETRT
ncbi:MAG: pyridoxamine 5'-phosphate oxidase family protein [Acidimicrobiales bacterium]